MHTTRLIYATALAVGLFSCQDSASTPEERAARPTEVPHSGALPVSEELTQMQSQLAEARARIIELQKENLELRQKLEQQPAVANNAAPKEQKAPVAEAGATEATKPAVAAPQQHPLRSKPESTAVPESPLWTKSVLPTPKRRYSFRTDDAEIAIDVTSLEWKKKRWVMNRSGYEYQYLEPDKGNFFVAFDLSVTTKLHNPKLPAFYVARISNGKLTQVGFLPAHLQFYKWDDYGSFLGNYADYGNDFSKSDTVRFTAALELKPEDLAQPLILVASREGCGPRKEDRFGRPPVKYDVLECPLSLKDVDAPDAFLSRYHIVAIHNASKLPR